MTGGSRPLQRAGAGRPVSKNARKDPWAGESDTVSYRIDLRGLKFFAYHGVLAEEQRRGQAFTVDVRLDCPGPPPAGDHIDGTVDYAAVYETIRQVVTGGPYQLIETVARKAAVTVLAEFAPVGRVAVTVHKPGAPLPGAFDDVAVTMAVERDGGR